MLRRIFRTLSLDIEFSAKSLIFPRLLKNSCSIVDFISEDDRELATDLAKSSVDLRFSLLKRSQVPVLSLILFEFKSSAYSSVGVLSAEKMVIPVPPVLKVS